MKHTETAAIEKNNPAMNHVVTYLDLGERRWVVGITANGDGYATWEVGYQQSSNLGHYGFTTLEEAQADMIKRAGLEQTT
jgi:hypothetical protein